MLSSLEPYIVTRRLGPTPGIDARQRRAIELEAIRRFRRDRRGDADTRAARREVAVPEAIRERSRLRGAQGLIGGIVASVAAVLIAFPTLAGVPAIPRYLIIAVLAGVGNYIAACFLHARAVAPWGWAILRERGIDACVSCGTIGGGSAREATTCPRCGFENPPGRRGRG